MIASPTRLTFLTSDHEDARKALASLDRRIAAIRHGGQTARFNEAALRPLELARPALVDAVDRTREAADDELLKRPDVAYPEDIAAILAKRAARA